MAGKRTICGLQDIVDVPAENSNDNSAQLERLRRNLRRAREKELTPRQQQMLSLHYDQGLNVSQIALKLGLNRSTVSRTIQRAQARLKKVLTYSF